MLLLLLAGVLAGACAPFSKQARNYEIGYREVGIASWYGPGFHGRRTSSGEVFDMHELTAAHRSLPFGTQLKVRHTENGRTVRVKVNDRGPFIRGRILDLSYAAAKQLDMIGTGIARVELVIVGHDPAFPRPAATPGRARGYYTVQVGAFKEKGNALRLKNQLENRYRFVYLETLVRGEERYYQVRVGRFRSRGSAVRFSEKFKSREHLDVLVVRAD